MRSFVGLVKMPMCVSLVAFALATGATSALQQLLRPAVGSQSLRRLLRRAAARTLYDKVFDEHVVTSMGGEGSGTALIYIDRHLVHEVSIRNERRCAFCASSLHLPNRVLLHARGGPWVTACMRTPLFFLSPRQVTSPQAFDGRRTAGRTVRRPDCTLATCDHNVPTSDRSGFADVASFIAEPESRGQVPTH